MKTRIESELSDKQVKLERLKSTKSPFKVYLNKTLPMIENLSHYWDKADGKTKKKILGCIFTEKFENFDFESCNHIFTPEINSIMLATNVLKSGKNKKEVKNDLLSKMAPPSGLFSNQFIKDIGELLEIKDLIENPVTIYNTVTH